MYQEIKLEAISAVLELIEKAKLKKGSILVIGCSTSEISGEQIGSNSVMEIAQTVFHAIYPKLEEKGIFMAVQCCEHLNRALIVERELADKLGLDIVNVLPQPKAGGSFAVTAYNSFQNPCAVEHIRADAGMDIGGTLIGMHLKEVAVPLRLSVCKIRKASLICAKVRPKFIGGARAKYNSDLL